ncbi:MAG: hypothetical protein HGGPFJEG_01170 [Ignavibacteria bacterium]|nr:hypothetical protein [Ignavibacteria bacterium]
MKNAIKLSLILFSLLFSLSLDCDKCDPYLLSASPGLEFTSVPSIGSNDDLKGRVQGVVPEEFSVAIYIYVSGWWNKPTFDNPLTAPDCNSNFICDITTGGIDPQASKIRGYLVRKNFNPPLLSGEEIPESLKENSLAWIEKIR